VLELWHQAFLGSSPFESSRDARSKGINVVMGLAREAS
jgi:hypothetical protein